jgi:hypothetical protein
MVSPFPHRTFSILLVIAALVIPPTVAVAQTEAPIPVVERFLTIRDREVRTSLFSNGIVVVSGRREGERSFFRQVQLTADEFTGYFSALERDAIELSKADNLPAYNGSGGKGVVILHVGPRTPLEFSYSSMTVYDLVTTRLLGTLDDLEQFVIWREPTGAGIKGWEPEIGDIVRLRSGGQAKVVDVQRDGTIIIEHESTYINEVVSEGQRVGVIFEVVDKER